MGMWKGYDNRCDLISENPTFISFSEVVLITVNSNPSLLVCLKLGSHPNFVPGYSFHQDN